MSRGKNMQVAASASIVSSDNEELILVDADDRETGFLSKGACHDGSGILHRAFSVFLFDAQGRLILQQRAGGKRLWPRYWSNSCCSHPRRGEDMQEATSRRLQQELGVSAELEFVYKFTYQASFGAAGAEHELCWVYLGRAAAEPRPNSTEIEALRCVSAAALDAELAQRGAAFTPWFKLEWQRLKEDFGELLDRYTSPA